MAPCPRYRNTTTFNLEAHQIKTQDQNIKSNQTTTINYPST